MNHLHGIKTDKAPAPDNHNETRVIWFDATSSSAQPSTLSVRMNVLLDQVEDDDRATILVLRHVRAAGSAHVHTSPAMDEHRHLEQQIKRMESLPAVSVAWVDGLCVGAMFELAVAADLCFATAGARFQCPQVQEGYLPALSVNRLPQLIGARAARGLLMFGETWNAQRAHAAGMIDGLLDTDSFHTYVGELARRLPADNGTARQMCRRLINEAHCTGYETGLGHFMAAQARCHDIARARRLR